jgi:hypothetical protein
VKQVPILLKKRKQRLDHIALDAEFLLISVIQGVALVTLANPAAGPLMSLQIQTWPYVIAAFIFILIFWSGAIIHAVSFIDWPIDLVHSFLYFLASLIEILAITSLVHPLQWFFLLFLFQVVAFILYFYDLRLIKQHKDIFLRNSAGKKLYLHMFTEQYGEIKLYLPISTLLFIIAVIAIYLQPKLFIQDGYHEILILLQILFAVMFLIKELKTFKIRTQLLLQYIEN